MLSFGIIKKIAIKRLNAEYFMYGYNLFADIIIMEYVNVFINI